MDATNDRWQAALRRAIKNGVQVRQLAGSGAWVATSGSDPLLAYETDGVACACPAAALGSDPVCQHRAAFRHAAGALELADEEPEPAAAAAGLARGLTAEETVALKADALRYAVERNAPLGDPFTGAVVDRANCAT